MFNFIVKGWCGRVEIGIINGNLNFFVISLDSKIIDKLLEKYFKEIVELVDGDNLFYFEILEEVLIVVFFRDMEIEVLNW